PPADQAPAPQAPRLDPRDQQMLGLQAQLLQMQGAAAAAPGARPTGGDVATPDMIAARLNSEQVFRAEFPMYEGMELGDGLHEKFRPDTAPAAGPAAPVGAPRTGSAPPCTRSTHASDSHAARRRRRAGCHLRVH